MRPDDGRLARCGIAVRNASSSSRVDDDVPRRDGVDPVGEGRADEVRVEQRDDPAHAADADPDRQVFRPVRHQQADRVALADPVEDRPARIAVRTFGQRAKRQRAGLRQRGRSVAELPRQLLHDHRKGPGRLRSQSAPSAPGPAAMPSTRSGGRGRRYHYDPEMISVMVIENSSASARIALCPLKLTGARGRPQRRMSHVRRSYRHGKRATASATLSHIAPPVTIKVIAAAAAAVAMLFPQVPFSYVWWPHCPTAGLGPRCARRRATATMARYVRVPMSVPVARRELLART